MIEPIGRATALLLGVASLTAAHASQLPPNRDLPPTTMAPPQTPREEMRVRADQIDKLLADGKVLFLDVRDPKELEELGTRPGYVNIPIGELEKRLNELPTDKAILTVCNGGGRAARAAAILQQHGYKSAGFCGLKDYKGTRVFPKPTK